MRYSEQMQGIVAKYRDAGEPWPATAKDIAKWAVQNRHWEPHPSAIIGQCADDLAKAMREEYLTDPQGRRVRAKHVALVEKDGKQKPIWDDIRTAPREHMTAAFQARRRQIVGDCVQLRVDVDSFNENRNAEEPIQIVFDFTNDVEEELFAEA